MGKAIGIDLGTTNTVAAEARAGRTAPTVVMTRDASNTTRSVVAFDDGQWLVGEMAVQVGKVNSAAIISSSKRFIGLRFGDARIREDIARLNRTGMRSRVVAPPEGEGGVRFHLYPASSSDVISLSPVDIAARVLRQVKQDAESALGGQVTHATITVPAYFDTARIEATRQAGEAAGFVVQRIISEPQAAAIAYGATFDAETIETALIYDLGGGTFDVTVATIGQDLCDELAKDGNNHLGGDDFDTRLVEIVSRKIRDVAGLDLSSAGALGVTPEKLQTTVFDLLGQCQSAKRLLSNAPEATISCSLHEWSETERRGAPRIIGVKVSRVEFEAAISDLIDETIVLTEQALKRANRAEETIDLVLLIGGSTFIPLVRERLRAKFGADKVRVNVNPMEAVAVGAAILAKVLPRLTQCPQCHADQSADNTTCERCGATLIAQPERNDGEGESTSGESKLAVISTLPHALGIETEEGAFEVVLKRGSQYSATDGASLSLRRKSFRVSKDGAPSIRIPVYEGDHPRAKDPTNTYCGEVLLTDLPLDLRQGEEVIVEITLNGDGAKVITTTLRGRPQRHVLDADGWRSRLQEKVQDVRSKVLPLATETSTKGPLIHAIDRATKTIQDTSASPADGRLMSDMIDRTVEETRESVSSGDLPPALEALSFALARAQAHCQYAARWVDRLPLVNDSFICERLEAEGQLLNIIRLAVVDGRRIFATRNDAGAVVVQARLNSLLESSDFLWPLTLAEIVSELRPDEEDGVRLSTRGLITDDELERLRAKASSAVQSSTSSSAWRGQYSQEIGVLLTQMRRTIVSDGALFMRQMRQVDGLVHLFFSVEP